MVTAKVTKKPTRTMTPKLHENIRISMDAGTVLSSSSIGMFASLPTDVRLGCDDPDGFLRMIEMEEADSLNSVAPAGPSEPRPSSIFGFGLRRSLCPQLESQTIVAIPPANIRIGKYHRALYNMPAVAPRKTKILVNLSVTAF